MSIKAKCPGYLFLLWLKKHVLSLHHLSFESGGAGRELNNGSTIGGMLFADDFIDVSDSKKLIDVVHAYRYK